MSPADVRICVVDRPSRLHGSGRKGFTLIEMSVTLGVFAILASLTFGMFDGLKSGANYRSGTGALVAGLRQTQQEAAGRGAYTAFVIDTVGGRWWGVQAAAGFDVNTFDPASPGTVIASGTLPTNTTFGPRTGWGAKLDPPLAFVPMVSSQSPNYLHCSFCVGSGYGAIVFEPGGRATFSGGPTAAGQFVVQGTDQNATRTLAVAIVGRSSLIQSFEK